MTAEHPYAKALTAVPLETDYWGRIRYQRCQWEPFVEHREKLVTRFSWAIPSAEALRRARAFAGPRLVEMGAGTGYWASLFEGVGMSVHAYDAHPTNNPYKHEVSYTTIRYGTPATLMKYDTRWALFLCWPPYDDPMAFRCLQHFKGERLVYVGESEGGCNASDKFFERLSRFWTPAGEVDIPQWDGINDSMSFWRR
jgi:hypothetical protein